MMKFGFWHSDEICSPIYAGCPQSLVHFCIEIRYLEINKYSGVLEFGICINIARFFGVVIGAERGGGISNKAGPGSGYQSNFHSDP